MSFKSVSLINLSNKENLKNLAAIGYALVGYVMGICALFSQILWVNLWGVLLTAHALLIASVLIHEFIHGTIFDSRSLNAFWGQVMMHLNGACYATWEQISTHHINHHVHATDFIPFDYANYLKTMSPGLRLAIYSLEWAYIPGFEFLIRLEVILAPFKKSEKYHLRQRMLMILAYRITLFSLLAYLSLRVFLLYLMAYYLCVSMMRLIETFHHTFEYTVQGGSITKRDRAYEQINTFSNVVSIQYPWLNLLYLNFGYHNAHHHNMRCPWHKLPQLHQDIFDESLGRYGDTAGNLLPFGEMVKTYHKFRLARVGGEQGEVYNERGEFSISHFTGGVGASFLTPP